MRRPPPEAAEMRGFALVLVAFRGEEGQGRGLTRRFFRISKPEEARLVLKLRAGSWAAGRAAAIAGVHGTPTRALAVAAA